MNKLIIFALTMGLATYAAADDGRAPVDSGKIDVAVNDSVMSADSLRAGVSDDTQTKPGNNNLAVSGDNRGSDRGTHETYMGIGFGHGIPGAGTIRPISHDDTMRPNPHDDTISPVGADDDDDDSDSDDSGTCNKSMAGDKDCDDPCPNCNPSPDD